MTAKPTAKTPSTPTKTATPATSATRLEEIELHRIVASPFNPRTRFDETDLAELAASIDEQGVLEPIIVRSISLKGEVLEIVAGERRFRAAKLAGLTHIPCLIRDLDDTQARIIAVTENKQRSDLDPLDEARGYQILKEGGMAQADIAERLGISAGEVSKGLALLELPDEVQALVRRGELGVGQARVIQSKWKEFPKLLPVVADYAIAHSLSVRNLEAVDQWEMRELGRDLLKKKLVREIGWETIFDTHQCHKCPLGAERKIGQTLYCLLPEEYDKKEREVIQAKQLEFQKEREATLERAKSLPAAKAGKEGELIKLSSLKSGRYQRIYRSPPEGCTESCECRILARDDQDRGCEVCLNPKRYESLATAATKKKNADSRKAAKARLSQIVQLAKKPEGGADFDKAMVGRAFALAAWKTLASLNSEARRAAIPMLPRRDCSLSTITSEQAEVLRSAFDHDGVSSSWEQRLPGLAEVFSQLSAYDRMRVMLAVGGAVAIYDSNEQLKNPDYRTAPHARFLMGEPVFAAKEANP